MNTAVAFIIFNRPDTAKRVFESIRQARPPRLYVIADGPRLSKPGEAEAVSATRTVIDSVDWPCEVTRLYSSENLGCKQRVYTGLNSVFEHEEQAIILEDDCLPDPTFFPYCESLLERYRDEEQVFHIGANQFQRPRLKRPYTYYFSKFPHCWGWATWRRAWRLIDLNLSTWDEAQPALAHYMKTDIEQAFWGRIFGRIRENPSANSSWAYPWLYTMWARNCVAINSTVNLVENLGFGADATHTVEGAWCLHRKAHPLKKLIPPASITLDEAADEHTFKCNHLLQETRRWRICWSRMRMSLGALRRKLLP
ncbi:MAG: glycosyltransferase family A protein [Puniceicoccales bacterium]